MKPRVPRVRVTPTFVAVSKVIQFFLYFNAIFQRWKAIDIVALICDKDKRFFSMSFPIITAGLIEVNFPR